jgi:hypothetical protein
MCPTPRKRLGDVLRERHSIDENALEAALAEQQDGTMRLGEILLQRGAVAKDDLIAALERQ